jgi:uncharacterized protein (UPF0276 family)
MDGLGDGSTGKMGCGGDMVALPRAETMAERVCSNISFLKDKLRRRSQ